MCSPLRTILFSATLILLAATAPAFAQTGMLSAEGGKGEMPSATSTVTPAAIPAENSSPPQEINNNVQTQAARMAETMRAQFKTTPAVNANTTPAPQATAQVKTQATANSTLSPLSPNNPAYVIPGPAKKKNDRSDDDSDPLKNPIFRSLSPATQNQIMEESQIYNRDCKLKGSYAKFHNCDCLALHYMNERIKNPDLNQSELQTVIQVDCVDTPSIAGYNYNQCIALYSSRYASILKPLCECYAREFAKAYTKAPNPTNMGRSNLEIKALTDCRTSLTTMTPDNRAGAPELAPNILP